jgi:hypothetical protein
MMGQRRPADMLAATGKKSAYDFFKLMVSLKKWQRQYIDAWKAAGLDAVLYPGLALPAFRHGDSADITAACSYTFVFNALHFPAGVCPVTTVQPGETSYTCPVAEQDMLASKAAEVCTCVCIVCQIMP